MANRFSKTGVVTGQTVEALHVSQSVDAFTGLTAYDVNISGSFRVTGSTVLSGSEQIFSGSIKTPNVTADSGASGFKTLVVNTTTGQLFHTGSYSGAIGSGAQGGQGVQGGSGTQGGQGASPQGSQGVQGGGGVQGPIGTGTQGVQGNAGTAQGGQGIQGGQGTTGASLTGPQGVQGVQGVTGTGTQGIQGIQGVQGPTGNDSNVQGGQGIQGGTGGTGPASNVQGGQGIVGGQGTQGITGASLTGPQGVQGVQGLQGQAGTAQGGQGIQGGTGGTGPASNVQGGQGIQGGTGTGTQGTQGIQGVQGPTGNDSNVQGGQGIVGGQGTQGIQGAEGSGGGGGGGTDFAQTVRYNPISGSAVNIQIKSSGNYYGGLSWDRSGTTLNITHSAHGLVNNDCVVVRNASSDYVYSAVTRINNDKFSIPVAASGGSTGTQGGYVVAFSASFTEALGTGDLATVVISDPASAISASHQLDSLQINSSAQESVYKVTVPRGINEGAAGLGTHYRNVNIPVAVGIGGDNQPATLGVTPRIDSSNVSGGNFNVFTLVGSDQSVGENTMIKLIF